MGSVPQEKPLKEQPMIPRRNFLTTASLGLLPQSALLPTSVRANDSLNKTPKARFRLGLVTYNVGALWDLKTLLSVCSQAGIVGVEFRTTHKHGVEPGLSKEERLDVKKRCSDAGIEIWGLGSTCEYQSVKPEMVRSQIETTKRFVELAADLGAKGVKVRPNGLPKEKPVSDTLKQIGVSMSECGEYATKHGVEIWCEVHGFGTQEPANMAEIMNHCPSPSVGVCWNSNPTDVKNGSIAQAYSLLGKHIKSCHINNLYNNFDKKYPYQELFQKLAMANYDRFTLIEVGKTFPDPSLGVEFLRYYKAVWTSLCLQGDH